MKKHSPERIALVTGAARGLGQTFAERLARDGCRLVLTDLTDCDETSALVAAAGSHAIQFKSDLSKAEEVLSLASSVLKEAGRVDILVNNAAYQPPTPFDQISPSLFRKIMAVNTEASFLLAQALSPSMKSRGWGRIVNLASSSAWAPKPGFVAYITSKMANVGLTRALAYELGDFGITVNAIAPGLTRTKAAAEALPEAVFDMVKATQLIHRTGMPEDLAGALSFLCSDDASFITGQTYHVDGGAVV